MSRSSRTCRRAAEVRWTVETHPTLIYCRSRQTVLGSLVANTGGGYDLTAPDAANTWFQRIDGATRLKTLACQVRKLIIVCDAT